MEFGKNEYINAMVDAIYDNNLFHVEQQSELKFFVKKLQHLLTGYQVASDAGTIFCDFIRRVLSHTVIYHLGSTVELSKNDDGLKITIWPHDKKIIRRCYQKINYESISDKRHIRFIVNQDNNPNYVISLKAIKVEDVTAKSANKPSEERSVVYSAQPEAIVTHSPIPAMHEQELTYQSGGYTPISAKEYLRENTIELEDVAHLSDIEREIFDIIDIADNKEVYLPYIAEIGAHLLKYGSILIYQYELSILATSLLSLSKEIAALDFGQLDEAKGRTIMMVLDSIAQNLQKWRVAIFEDQNSEDIHFLDASFEADCKQVKILCGSDDGGDEETGELVFF